MRHSIVVADVKLVSNSFFKLVENMRKMGLNANTAKTENEKFIEYTVRIKKAHPSIPHI